MKLSWANRGNHESLAVDEDVTGHDYKMVVGLVARYNSNGVVLDWVRGVVVGSCCRLERVQTDECRLSARPYKHFQLYWALSIVH